ncbi:MAG: hypothetical protein U1F76_14595 [Candidatus Competibacteraceae bacterium]
MSSESKVKRLILELTRATVEGKLDWEIKPSPDILSAGTNDVIPTYYETTFKGQTIGLFQRRYLTPSVEYNGFLWNESTVLVFLDSTRKVIWEYSEFQSALYNLFQVVRDSCADVEEILDKLLAADNAEK